VLFVGREVEAMGRRLAIADYALVDEIEVRDLPGRYLTRNAAGMLSALLRITPHEAHARVKEARQLGPRTTVSGEVLAPVRAMSL